MYIKNDIVYAGDPTPPLKIISAWVVGDYMLRLRFNNGEVKDFDFTPLLDEPAFRPLKDKNIFNGVYVDYGCTVWNDGAIDIAPEHLFENGISANN